jgi:uncharacterized membrane protein
VAELDEFKELKQRGLDRILGLSDGIFAFAITLMVLDLVVPAIAPGQEVSALPGLLAGEWVGFLNYFFSFAIIAIWWNAHHRLFEYIVGYDGILKGLNLLLLLTVTLTPFFTKLLDTWNTAPFATALYATNQGVAGTFLALMWNHASKGHKFIIRSLGKKAVDRVKVVGILTPILFFASVPLAVISPGLTQSMWYAILPAVILARRRYR